MVRVSWKVSQSRYLLLSIFVIALTLVLTCRELGNAGQQGRPPVRTDRPRLLIDSNDLARIRKAIKGYSQQDFVALKRYVDRRLADTSADRLAHSGGDIRILMSTAFVALVTSEERYCAAAIAYGLAYAGTSPKSGNDTDQRNRLLAMAYVYDWLHDMMRPQERERLRLGIIAHIRELRHFIRTPLYTGGHDRYGSTTIMAGLIALHGDYRDFEGDALLVRVCSQWEEGYNPFQSFVAWDGGYHMGWKYGCSYTDPLPYLLWEKATGQRWGEEWRRKQIYWLIHGVRGDGSLPRFGDCWDTSLQEDAITFIAAVSAGHFQNPHGEWFYRTYYSNCWEPRRIYRIIFRNPQVTPAPPNMLNSAACFTNAGFVVSRDSWTSDATHLVFKSTPFYTRNHHHKDQNHLELSYKGSLLIDSGVYDSFGSSHWKNYFSRTVAHNTLVVYDPSESFVDGGPVTNDGGQRYPNLTTLPLGREPRDLSEASSGKYRLNGLTGFGFVDGVTWMRGEATLAYDPKKLTQYTRDILMVNRPAGRRHPFIIVFDRVGLAKPLIPKILFHSNDKPLVTENVFRISNVGGGILYGKVTASPDSKMELVGGPGREWWVDGKNYPPASSWEGKGVDAGSWRIEASTTSPAKNVEFLTFMAVADASKSESFPAPERVSGEGYAGFLVERELYLVFSGHPDGNELRFDDPRFATVRKVYAAGLQMGRKYRFIINGRLFSSTGTEVVIVGPEG